MITGIALSILSFIAVVIGVFTGTPRPGTRIWQTVNAWGYAALVAAALICVFSIQKAVKDSLAEETLMSEIVRLKTKVKEEGSRLRPSDFQLRLMVVFHSASPPSQIPETVPVSGGIGNGGASYGGELESVNNPRHLGGGRGAAGSYAIRYYAENLTFNGLDRYLYLDRLNGNVLTARIDVSRFADCYPDRNIQPVYYLDVYIQGHLFNAHQTDNGHFKAILDWRSSE
jgi:hypothetical protein